MRVLLLLLPALCLAHVCILQPQQRGGADISTPGAHACVKPAAPCGGMEAEAPAVTLVGGTGFDVFFQQNLNHYNPGWPGFLDVAWYKGAEPVSDDDFSTLVQIPDYYAHKQATQTNFSVPIVVPNVDCDHCTLRVRYNPNKPGEPVFHQCADIRITKKEVPVTWGTIVAQAADSNEAKSSYAAENFVSIQESGVLAPLAEAPCPCVLSDGLVAADSDSQLVYYVGNKAEAYEADAIPDQLCVYDLDAKKFRAPVQLAPPTDGQWNSLVATYNAEKPLVAISQQKVEDGFRYGFYYVCPKTGKTTLIANSVPESTYVNFFWADIHRASQQLYVLVGDEDSAFDMNANILTVDLAKGTVAVVAQNVSAYTLLAFHVQQSTGDLYALSSGLFETHAAWSVVKINPSTGDVSLSATVAPDGVYRPYAYGNVFGTALNGNSLMHVFQRGFDDTSLLAAVDIKTGAVTFGTTLQTGINEHFVVRDIVHVLPRGPVVA